jgi:hypothetical protein
VNNNEIEVLMSKLENFVLGKNRTLTVAGEIEVSLEKLFSDDDEIQDYVTCFASYKPGGGEYLYDETAMIQKSKCLINLIRDRFYKMPSNITHIPVEEVR